jgi:D-alanyl-D-alanine carboxypeptidase
MLIGFAFGALLGAIAPVPPTPPAHAFTATMEHQIDDLGNRIVQTKRSPGVALGIVEDGRIVYARGFGISDAAIQARFLPETQTYVGAVSQQFTAAAILLLAQDGKLKLGDPVIHVLPELTVAKDVTIRELLDQTSGLPDLSAAKDIDQDRTKSIKLDQIVAALNALPPLSAPGSQYRYNDANYIIAGMVVERAGGIPLSDYLQQNIFIPLLMNQTFYAGDNGISPSHALGHTGAPGAFTHARTLDPAWLFGGDGLVTNVYDLAKWDIGMPLLLRVDAEREMFTPSSAPGPNRFGLGWVIDERDGRRYIWDSSEIPGYRAMNALLPEDHVAVIVLANTDGAQSHAVIDPERVAAQILDIVLPPAHAHAENAIVTRAQEWLNRIAEKNIDRTQLTPAFSKYLTDDVVVHARFAALGKLLTMIPIASVDGSDGGTIYEFIVRFQHGQYQYHFGLAKDGRIDQILLVPQ